MDKESITKLIKSLSAESETLTNVSRESPEFKTWLDKCYRRLSIIYGDESWEMKSFGSIPFLKKLDKASSPENAIIGRQRLMDSCIREAQLFFVGLIEELDLLPKQNFTDEPAKNASKIFISHSSKDKKLVSEIVHLLSLMGMQDSQIFCTSLDGYGIPLGDDWLETLKAEVSGEVIVLFVLSENYYKSSVSLCEMGAAWALSKKHIPILIPPMEYSDMQGVIPLTQGFKVDEKQRWTRLKSQLEIMFNLTPKTPEIWESRRDEILDRIDDLLIP